MLKVGMTTWADGSSCGCFPYATTWSMGIMRVHGGWVLWRLLHPRQSMSSAQSSQRYISVPKQSRACSAEFAGCLHPPFGSDVFGEPAIVIVDHSSVTDTQSTVYFVCAHGTFTFQSWWPNTFSRRS